MKAILEFNLPEDRSDFEIHNKSTDMYCALTMIREKIFRPIRKHGYSNPELQKLSENEDVRKFMELLETEYNQLLKQNEVDSLDI